jgi:hypothetical protein
MNCENLIWNLKYLDMLLYTLTLRCRYLHHAWIRAQLHAARLLECLIAWCAQQLDPCSDQTNKQHQTAILAAIYPVSGAAEAEQEGREGFLLHGTLLGLSTLSHLVCITPISSCLLPPPGHLCSLRPVVE